MFFIKNNVCILFGSLWFGIGLYAMEPSCATFSYAKVKHSSFCSDKKIPSGHSDVCAVGLSDDELCKLIEKNKNIKVLRLEQCEHITDQGFAAVRSLGQLQAICILGPVFLTDEAFFGLDNLSDLRIFFMADNQCVTDKVITYISACSHLERIGLCSCDNITGEGLRELNRLSFLCDVNMSGCKHLRIPEHFIADALSELRLSECSALCNDDMARIALLRSLRVLDIAQCPQISMQGFVQLQPLALEEIYLGEMDQPQDQGTVFVRMLFPCIKKIRMIQTCNDKIELFPLSFYR